MQQLMRIYKSQPPVTMGGNGGTRHLRYIALLAALLAGIALAGCDQPYDGVRSESGSLRVSIGEGAGLQPLTLLPDTSMEPTEYRLRGSGPLGASFETTTTGGVLDIHDLRGGEWRIEVTAVNGDGLEIGYGDATVGVEPGMINEVAVSVRALSGTGTLSLQVSWPAAEVQNASLAATLTGRDGQSQQLQFAANGTGGAAYTNDALDAGYYTLVIQLFDGDNVVAGAVETVRIVQDGHTEGTFSFDDLNHPTGDVDIAVSPEMDEPLELELTGTAEVLAFGSTKNVSATAENAGSAEVVYTWYVNGAHVGDGASQQVGTGLAVGSYRLDVVAFSADGRRSGSLTHRFRVE